MRTLIAGIKLDRLLAELALAPAGIVVEMGVYQGGSLAAMAAAAPHRAVYGFDTFTGLPRDAWQPDEPHSVGDFGDTSLEAVRAALAGLPNAHLVPGLFPESADAAGVDGPVALAHVDFDFYRSTLAAIWWLLPRLVPGGVIVFDDHGWKHCPGVAQAIAETGLQVEVLAGHQAIHRKERA